MLRSLSFALACLVSVVGALAQPWLVRSEGSGPRRVNGLKMARAADGGGSVALTHIADFAIETTTVVIASFDPLLNRRWTAEYRGDGLSRLSLIDVAVGPSGQVAVLLFNDVLRRPVVLHYAPTGALQWVRLIPSTVGELQPGGIHIEVDGTVRYFGTAFGINGVLFTSISPTGVVSTPFTFNNNAPGSIVGVEFNPGTVAATLDLGDGYGVGVYSFANGSRTFWVSRNTGQPVKMALTDTGRIFVGLVDGSPQANQIHDFAPPATLPAITTYAPLGAGVVGNWMGLVLARVEGVQRARGLVDFGTSYGIFSPTGDPFGSEEQAGQAAVLTNVGPQVSISRRNFPTSPWSQTLIASGYPTFDYPADAAPIDAIGGSVRAWIGLTRRNDSAVLVQGVGAGIPSGWAEIPAFGPTADYPMSLRVAPTGDSTLLRRSDSPAFSSFALERRSRAGTLLWTRTVASTFGRLGEGAHTLFSNGDPLVVYGSGAVLRAVRFSAATGNPVWTRVYDLRSRETPNVAQVLVTPAGDVIVVAFANVVGTASDVVAMRLRGTGAEVWRHVYNPGGSWFRAAADCDAAGSPVLLVRGSDAERVIRLSATTGLPIWDRPATLAHVVPPILTADGGVVYLARNATVVRLSAATGATTWQRPLSFAGLTSPGFEAINRLPNGNLVAVGSANSGVSTFHVIRAMLSPTGTVLFRGSSAPASGKGLDNEDHCLVVDPTGLFHVAITEFDLVTDAARPIVFTYSPTGAELRRRLPAPTMARGRVLMAAGGSGGDLLVAGKDNVPFQDVGVFLLREIHAVTPIAVADRYTVNRGQRLVVAAPGLLANDSNPVPGAVRTAVLSGPSVPGLTLNANGSLVYQAGLNPGTVVFRYQAVLGSNRSAPATVTITVR